MIIPLSMYALVLYSKLQDIRISAMRNVMLAFHGMLCLVSLLMCAA